MPGVWWEVLTILLLQAYMGLYAPDVDAVSEPTLIHELKNIFFLNFKLRVEGRGSRVVGRG